MDLHLPGATVTLDRDFIPADEATALMGRLLATLPWRQGWVTVRGERFREPRLTSWHGSGSYTYSGRTIEPEPWTDELQALRVRVEAATGTRFDSVLANNYRAGHRDSIGLHSDDEPDMKGSVIASISLGEEREFLMVPKKGRAGSRTRVRLPHGSLLVMAGDTQRNWLHGVEKAARPSERGRLNLTFRLLRR